MFANRQIGCKVFSTRLLFHAAMPSSKPMVKAKGAATTKTDIVSMANFHCPMSAVQTKVPVPKNASRQPPDSILLYPQRLQWPSKEWVRCLASDVANSRLAVTSDPLQSFCQKTGYINQSQIVFDEIEGCIKDYFKWWKNGFRHTMRPFR